MAGKEKYDAGSIAVLEGLEADVYKRQPLDYLQNSIGPAHNTVSLGLDGLILRGVLHLKKLPFCKGRVPYFISSGLAILSTRTLDLEIEADGEIFSGRYCEVAFGLSLIHI